MERVWTDQDGVTWVVYVVAREEDPAFRVYFSRWDLYEGVQKSRHLDAGFIPELGKLSDVELANLSECCSAVVEVSLPNPTPTIIARSKELSEGRGGEGEWRAVRLDPSWKGRNLQVPIPGDPDVTLVAITLKHWAEHKGIAYRFGFDEEARVIAFKPMFRVVDRRGS